MRTYKLNTKLEVVWLDTVQDPKWQTAKDASKRPKAVCRSMGYFLKADDDFFYISSTISGDERDVTAIPLGVVKQIKTLR